MKTVQEMTQGEFEKKLEMAKNGTETNELLAKNIRLKWSVESGYYLANTGDCDGGEIIEAWYRDEADPQNNNYVSRIECYV